MGTTASGVAETAAAGSEGSRGRAEGSARAEGGEEMEAEAMAREVPVDAEVVGCTAGMAEATEEEEVAGPERGAVVAEGLARRVGAGAVDLVEEATAMGGTVRARGTEAVAVATVTEMAEGAGVQGSEKHTGVAEASALCWRCTAEARRWPVVARSSTLAARP